MSDDAGRSTDGGSTTAESAGSTDATASDDTLTTLASGTRIRQFLSVGVVGFVCDLTVSTTLSEVGVFPELAAAAGIEVAIVVMFLLNDRVTFADAGIAGLGPTLRRLARSNLVRLGGTAVQLVTFSAVFRLPSVTLTVAGVDAWFVLARTAGIGVGMIVNYVAESLFTWRVTR